MTTDLLDTLLLAADPSVHWTWARTFKICDWLTASHVTRLTADDWTVRPPALSACPSTLLPRTVASLAWCYNLTKHILTATWWLLLMERQNTHVATFYVFSSLYSWLSKQQVKIGMCWAEGLRLAMSRTGVNDRIVDTVSTLKLFSIAWQWITWQYFSYL